MQINIQDFIDESGLGEAFYPGKRVIKTCPQPGEFRSHCVIYDWRDPSLIRIEIKAGLTGFDLPANDLARYPVSFQSPTFIEIDVHSGRMKHMSANAEKLSHFASAAQNRNDEDDTDEDSSTSGKSGGGGGKRPAKKSKSELERTEKFSSKISSFTSAVAGKLPDVGNIVNVVIMGMKIAEEAYKNVVDKLTTQMKHAKIVTAELMIAAGKMVMKYTPPAFLQPKGDENKTYKYNREKNEPMFSGPSP